MAIRKRKKSKAAHKRTKKSGLMKRRLYAKIRRHGILTKKGISNSDLKKWDKLIDHEVRGYK